MLVNVMSEEIKFVNTKEALVGVDYDAVCSEVIDNDS